MSGHTKLKLSKSRRLKLVEILDLHPEEELSLFQDIEFIINITPLPLGNQPFDIKTTKLAIKQCSDLQKTLNELPRYFSEALESETFLLSDRITKAEIKKNGITYKKITSRTSKRADFEQNLQNEYSPLAAFFRDFSPMDLKNGTPVYFRKKSIHYERENNITISRTNVHVEKRENRAETHEIDEKIENLSEVPDELKNMVLSSESTTSLSEHLTLAVDYLQYKLEESAESKKLDYLISVLL
ncbi:MAG: hypothetical protein ACI9Y1_001877 [Lentisphaeria bacterium]|jgi:hypothetical protein